MTRKDFEFIADIIHRMPPMTRAYVTRVFAAYLYREYPRFNVDKFEAACLKEKTE